MQKQTRKCYRTVIVAFLSAALATGISVPAANAWWNDKEISNSAMAGYWKYN